jgi:predicted metal-dependent peptidase
MRVIHNVILDVGNNRMGVSDITTNGRSDHNMNPKLGVNPEQTVAEEEKTRLDHCKKPERAKNSLGQWNTRDLREIQGISGRVQRCDNNLETRGICEESVRRGNCEERRELRQRRVSHFCVTLHGCK